MKGSRESQPPRFTPLAGLSVYAPQEVPIAGTFGFALLESSHVEFNPMIGRSPTVSFVYVTLKSVVSYHENGSRYVPFAAAGILDSDIPLRFEFDGFPDSLFEELELELELEPPPLFFLVTTTATTITMIRITTNIPPNIPGAQLAFCHTPLPRNPPT
jgi:hypothetical protein